MPHKSKENYINRKFEHDRSEFDKTITFNSRAYLIADSIASGLSYRLIVSQYMNEWGVSYNYMHSIITEAINMFSSDEIYKKIRDINNERLTNIYLEARAKGDLDVAIKAVDKLNKSNGVYDEPKTSVAVLTDDTNVVITFGGQTIDLAEASFKAKPEDVVYNEVDELMNKALNKKDDE